MPLLTHAAQRIVLSALQAVDRGRLTVVTRSGTSEFGGGDGMAASMDVHDARMFRRLLTGGEIGLGESYVDGDWTTPDLVAVMRVLLANRERIVLPSALSWAAAARDAVRHWLRNNTRAGSRRNIQQHYDLSNDFFALFLDPSLQYSCALYATPDDSLATAQRHQLRRVCEALDLSPTDRLLEIGTGWGGLAQYAATQYGCHVTTTTISPAQHAYAAERFRRAGKGGARIDLRLEDYRELRGRFDKIVSIEMFEAVGLDHYDDFFGACDRLLAPGGLLFLQTITVDDWRFREYRRTPNWISKHVFPGGELASVAEILASMARVSRLGLHRAQQIGAHYARTLHDWRHRFHARLPDVLAQGFDRRFVRMWDLYLASCEAAFLDRHVDDIQLLFSKAPHRPLGLDDAWRDGVSLDTADIGAPRMVAVDEAALDACASGSR